MKIANLQELKEHINIIDVIGNYLPDLKKAGSRQYKAECPFNEENTPSFMVSEQKQIFCCFGCGEKGDAIDFVKKYQKLSFHDAVKEVAKLTGFELRYEQEQEQPKSYDVNNHHRYIIATTIKARKDFWNKPASLKEIQASLPTTSNGELYKGVNSIILRAFMELKEYKTPIFLTMQQAKQISPNASLKQREQGVRTQDSRIVYNIEQFSGFNKDIINDLIAQRDSKLPSELSKYKQEAMQSGIKRMFNGDFLIPITTKQIENYLHNVVNGLDHDGNKTIKQEYIRQRQPQKPQRGGFRSLD